MRVTPSARHPASELAVWHERVRDGISRWASLRGQVRRQALRRRLSHQIRVVRAAIEQLEGADLAQGVLIYDRLAAADEKRYRCAWAECTRALERLDSTLTPSFLLAQAQAEWQALITSAGQHRGDAIWLDHLGRLVEHVDQLFHELHDPGLHPQLTRWIQTRMAYVKFQRGAVGRGLEPDWSFAPT